MMGSLSNQETWVPFVNSKDCSQGFCSLYCPQWCYLIFPPPPPPPPSPPLDEFNYDNSSPKLSPLVIAVIGILASAFLLASYYYYTIISKYCGNTTRIEINEVASDEELELSQNPSFNNDHEPWHHVLLPTRGLDETLIKSIRVCKFNKKGSDHHLIEGSDNCSVCLSDFEEDERIRVLPKCNHAFHVPCIDTWLKSHSNCPLCRANVFPISSSPPPPPPPPPSQSAPPPPPLPMIITEEDQGTSENNEAASGNEQEDLERGIINFEEGELGNLQGTDKIIEKADEGYNNNHQQIRRSVSMDHYNSCQRLVSEKSMNQISMKRSFTTGRFSLINRQ